jgi:hypothetical protein
MRSYFTAGFLALAFGVAPILAQDAQAPPSQQTPEKPAQKPTVKPKKVWTNDDLAELQSIQITTAAATPAPEGEAPVEAGAPTAAPGKEKRLPDEKNPEYYRKLLKPLRAQRDQLDAKIKEIQDALANPYNGTNKISLTQPTPTQPSQGPEPGSRPDDSLYGNEIVTPKDQLTAYQQQRDKVQQQIDDLETQARRNGLDPGDIQ